MAEPSSATNAVKKTTEAQPSILFVEDDQISREKIRGLISLLNHLRQKFDFSSLRPQTTQDELLKQLQTRKYSIVLVPWKKYFEWTKIEAFLGSTRTIGTIFAGYFAENVSFADLGEKKSLNRMILVDFSSPASPEAVPLMLSLALEKKRLGIQHFLRSTTPIYIQDIYSHPVQGSNVGQSSPSLGAILDNLSTLDEVHTQEWDSRINSVRACTLALWSLLFDQSNFGNLQARNQNKTGPIAQLQFAADPNVLALRLLIPNASPAVYKSLTDLTESFWPDRTRSYLPSQILLRHADTVRVNAIVDSLQGRPSGLEIDVQFFQTANIIPKSESVKNLWIHPCELGLQTEPFLLEDALLEAKTRPAFAQRYRLFPKASALSQAAVQARKQETDPQGPSSIPYEQFDLDRKQALELLKQFRSHYESASQEIRSFEVKLRKSTEEGAPPEYLATLKREIDTLTALETEWILELSKLFNLFKTEKAKRIA